MTIRVEPGDQSPVAIHIPATLASDARGHRDEVPQLLEPPGERERTV